MRKEIWKKAVVWSGLAIVTVLVFANADRLILFFVEYSDSDRIFLGEVVSAEDVFGKDDVEKISYQRLEVKLLSGTAKNDIIEVKNRGLAAADPNQKIMPGERIVVSKNAGFSGDPYLLSDRYRLSALAAIFLIFVFAVLVLARWQGLAALAGLAFSIGVFGFFIAPQILAGRNPLLVGTIGAFAIALISLYFAHGFNRRTTVALIGTLLTLMASVAMTVIFSDLAQLTGLASEEAFYLKLANSLIDLRGLVLAAIIIGMLGILDDVTMGQAATVFEIREANSKLGFRELYRRGLIVGKEHVASLVNTLFLAYAGAAMPLFLISVMNKDQLPLWWLANGEPIAEEIIRTLAGSLALLLAVPITTLLAAYWFSREKPKKNKRLNR